MSATRLFVRADLEQTILAAAALGTAAAAAWVLLAVGAVGHPSHEVLLGSGQLPRPGALLAFLGQWQLMVVATMLPLAIPAVVARARRTRRWLATTGAVAAATCAVWTGFAVAALAGDAMVHRLVAAWPWLGSRQWLVTAALLVLAGAVHLAPSERRALAAARSPSSAPLRYAISCLGSCWALMLVMFAVGAERLLWMAVLAAVMTVERVTRYGPRLAPLVGLALISAAVLAPLHTGGLL
jgi:predicted metal-binding membrane protein